MKKSISQQSPEKIGVQVEITNQKDLAKQIEKFLGEVEKSQRQPWTKDNKQKPGNRIMVGTIKFRVRKN